MIRRLRESKENQKYVARLDDGEVFYEGELNDVFKAILCREIDKYYTVESAVTNYLRRRGYADFDEWSSDELADIFVDEFIEDDNDYFDMFDGFILVPSQTTNFESSIIRGESYRRRRRYRR